MENILLDAKRIVIKVGTSTLNHPNGKLNLLNMEALVRQIAIFHNEGREVVLVTSGAVGSGLGRLNLTEKPSEISKKQALAAIGQGILMQNYQRIFGELGINIAQVLLTGGDLGSRKRFLNARNTFNALFEYGVVPIVNENDTVAVDEIKVGDNDTLSALLATAIEADLLILLTDIDGLYDANPRTNPDAKKIDVVYEIDDKIIASAGGAGSDLGTGGMATKITAAQIVSACGIPMALVSSEVENILVDTVHGVCAGTLFLPKEHILQGKKGWLAFSAQTNGALIIDTGASCALINKGCSLLASGIKEVSGIFKRGEIISVFAADVEIARGIVNYSSEDLAKIKGHKSEDFIKFIEHINEDEIIHRDNLSLRV